MTDHFVQSYEDLVQSRLVNRYCRRGSDIYVDHRHYLFCTAVVGSAACLFHLGKFGRLKIFCCGVRRD